MPRSPIAERLTAGDVDRGLSDRALLITWLNRGTLHLVRSEDYPWLQGARWRAGGKVTIEHLRKVRKKDAAALEDEAQRVRKPSESALALARWGRR